MSPSETTLTVLDVGHGSCCILHGDSRTTLVDTGPGAAVLEYLLEQGITEIDLVVLSHADDDHIRGLIALLGAEEFSVRRVMLNSDSAKESESWTGLAWELDELRRIGEIEFDIQLREGQVLPCSPDDFELQVLAPRDGLAMLGPGNRDRRGRRITTNTISAVVLVCYRGFRAALVCGDLDEVGLSNLKEAGQDLTAEILIFPHHGGLAGGSASRAQSFALELTKLVSPTSVVVSMGRGKYANPRPEIVAGILGARADVRVSCTQLSGGCAASLPELAPSHLLPLYASGKKNRKCCAGTMRVAFNPSGLELLPNRAAHDAFIVESAPTALCSPR